MTNLFDLAESQKSCLTRADQIFERFKKFHKENPLVWEYFKKFAAQAITSGKKYSGRTIIERVRWEVEVETNSHDGLKINDHFSPYYTRMYLATHPEAYPFFEIRKRTSAERKASNVDVPVFNSGTIDDESDLMNELKYLGEEG